jgi:hypothetical protein
MEMTKFALRDLFYIFYKSRMNVLGKTHLKLYDRYNYDECGKTFALKWRLRKYVGGAEDYPSF